MELVDLVKASRARDRAAFGAIVRRFQDMAYGGAFSWLGDAEEARDAAQDAFIEAWESLEQLRDPSAFPGWFRRIVLKHADRYKRRRKPEMVMDDWGRLAADQPDALQLVEQQEFKLGVRSAIEGLAESHRLPLTLYHLDGLSQREVAAFLELPVTTVKKRIFDARKALERRINDMTAHELDRVRPSQDNAFSLRVGFFLAAWDGDEAEVKRILDVAPDLLDERGGQGDRTALHAAAIEGYAGIARLLLSRGADPSVRCGTSQATPLHNAAASGQLAIVELLLGAGADPNATDDELGLGVIGWATALHGSPNDSNHVEAKRRDQIVTLLLRHGAIHTIWSALALGDVEAVREALLKDPSAVESAKGGPIGMRPLILAVKHGRAEIVRLLIEVGADVDAADGDGLTALDHIAIDHSAHEDARDIVEMLIAADARLSPPAAALLGRRVPEDGTSDWDAFVYWVAQRGTAGDLQTLLDHGGDVSGGFPQRWDASPLHVALYNSREVAEVLIRNGADLFARDRTYGGTLVQWAEHGGDQELAAWLRERGAR